MRRLFITLLVVRAAGAAISANTVWEIRTAGADTNGGGFVATGTDMSQFDNKNAAACTLCQSATVNISTTDGVTAGTTTITSVSGNYSSALIGNIVHIQGGTGSVASAWYQVLTVPGATSFTVDRSTGLTAGTGVSVDIGGALLTPLQYVTSSVASNKGFLKTGSYSVGSTLSYTHGVSPAAPSTMPNQLIGYYATRGDCDNPGIPCTARPTILATADNIRIIDDQVGGWYTRNIIIDLNNHTNGGAIRVYVYSTLYNSKVVNLGSGALGIETGQTDHATIMFNEVTASNANCGVGIANGGASNQYFYNYVHDLRCTGMVLGSSDLAVGNVIANITNNSTAEGINNNGSDDVTVINNTIYNVMANCISAGAPFRRNVIMNNIISTCNVAAGTNYGINGPSSAGTPAMPFWDGNAFFSAGTANRHNIDDTTTNTVNGINPYVNSRDVQLSGNPFTSTGTLDLSLLGTAGGARGTGVPTYFSGSSMLGFMSFGAVQPNPAASSGAGGGGRVY